MEVENNPNDYFNDQNKRYMEMPASPINPEAIAKMIKELHGNLQLKSRQNQRGERLTDLVSNGKSKPTLTISAENLEWREGNQDNFKVDHFSAKPLREKFTALYNQKKAAAQTKTTTEKKELEVFPEIPEEVKYYDECFLKMANIASIQGLGELFAPNFVLNAYYFMTVSDSPGYAAFIINYCIKNLTSHIPVGWYFPASDNKRTLNKEKFCETAAIPEDDFDVNLRLGEQLFEFSDEQSLKQLVEPILENTENEEGVGLLLLTHTSHEKTIQLKEKEMQKNLFKDILAALYLLADNGHLILKTYTLFQRMSVELLFLLYALFEEVRIVKINSSSPRKLERFFVCTKFNQEMGKGIREKMVSLLPKLSSPEFMKDDIGFLSLFIVKTAPEFVKFVDGATKVFIEKLTEKLNQPKTSKSDKIDSRQVKRLLGKWKLMELSESDISDQEDTRPQYNRNRNYNNDSRPPRDFDNRDNRDNSGFDDRRRGNRGNYRGNRGYRGGGGDHRGDNRRRYDNSDDRQRHDRSDDRDRDRDRPRNDRYNNDRRRDRSNERSGDRRRGGGRDNTNWKNMTEEERYKRAEKKEIRQGDILTKDLVISSFDVLGFLGVKEDKGKKGKQK